MLHQLLRPEGPSATNHVPYLAATRAAWHGVLGPPSLSAPNACRQIFFAAVGASGEVRAVITTAPALFLFCFVQIAGHLGLILGVGRAAGFTRRELLLASNANVGGA